MENQCYLGIDLDDHYAVISYFQPNMKEPETISMVAGSGVFQIPLLLTKKKGIGQWFIGEDAKKLALKQGEEEAGMLLSKAMHKDTSVIEGERYQGQELLALYLKKLILLAGTLRKPAVPDRLVISIDRLSKEAAELFYGMASLLGLNQDQIMLIDRKESFYYFAYSQKKELWMHDIGLFDYRKEEMRCFRLVRNTRTTPQLVTLEEEVKQVDEGRKDESFLRIIKENFREHIIGAAYLVGDGFEGDWMKTSLAFLCRGRRAFIGKNLYSKGACYAAAVKDMQMEWPFVYMGDNEMKVNVSIKLVSKGQMEFYTLISAGENCYETMGECEVLLSGTPEIDFWLQPPNSREAKIETLEFGGLPKREDKATRLRITAKPLSDTRVQIQIEDLGFGEIFKSSGRTWEHVVAL